MELDLRRTIDEESMSRFQTLAVAVCIMLNMLDGFDVLAVAFSAPHLSADWHLAGKQIGLLLSAGLAGMTVGSLFVSPLADRIGRRPLVIACLVTIAGGMLAASIAQNLPQLIGMRVLTGVGIGGMLPSVAVIAAEYSSNRWRSGAVSMQSAGYTFGATVGGAVSGLLLAQYGWRSVFLFGGLSTFAVLPLVWYALPESLEFLVTKRPSGALDRVNVILDRMGRQHVDAMPEFQRVRARVHDQNIDTGPTRRRSAISRTILIWLSFCFVMAGFHFVMSWTPKLLVQAGMSAGQGVTGGVLLNIGGTIGCIVFSLITTRINLYGLLTTFLLISAALLGLFGACASTLQLSMPLAIAMGATISACVGGLYALTPRLYPPEARATGVGWAVGVGRGGAILSPLIAGALIDAGWQVPRLYYLYASPFILAFVTVSVLYFLSQTNSKSRLSDQPAT